MLGDTMPLVVQFAYHAADTLHICSHYGTFNAGSGVEWVV